MDEKTANLSMFIGGSGCGSTKEIKKRTAAELGGIDLAEMECVYIIT